AKGNMRALESGAGFDPQRAFAQVVGRKLQKPQSALMWAARITLPHFSVSSAMSLPKSAGEPRSTVPPRSARCAFILESARPALISLLSLSIIAAGVALGAPRPKTELAS